MNKNLVNGKEYSPKTLRYCQAFYRFYSNSEKWQQVVAKMKRFHLDDNDGTLND